MTDHRTQTGVLPPDVVTLMQERIDMLSKAVKNVENTSQIRSLLIIREALDKEAVKLISALDHGSLEGSGFVSNEDLPWTMFNKLINRLTSNAHKQNQTELYRRLLAKEAKIGGELFGPVSSGSNREFFCLDEHMWVWHEERPDKNGNLLRRTTRYDIRPDGIYKAQDGQEYKLISVAEAQRLYDGAQIYYQRVKREIYKYA